MTNKERIRYFKDRKVIGIDPGKNGGIAVYSLDKKRLIDGLLIFMTHLLF